MKQDQVNNANSAFIFMINHSGLPELVGVVIWSDWSGWSGGLGGPGGPGGQVGPGGLGSAGGAGGRWTD